MFLTNIISNVIINVNGISANGLRLSLKKYEFVRQKPSFEKFEKRLKNCYNSHKRRNETRMIYAVIFFVICGKKRFKRYDMHIVVILAQSPKAIRRTVYGTENIFIFVKRSVLGCTAFNLFPELLRQFSSGCCIIIRIYSSLFYAGKIKYHIPDFDIMIA